MDASLVYREDKGVTKLVPLYPPVKRNKFLDANEPLPKYTMAEVAKHSTQNDCWIVLDKRAYNITSFIARHPGGVGPITNMAGKDATDVFANYHAARVYRVMLPAYLVGEVTDVPEYPHVADFRAAHFNKASLKLTIRTTPSSAVGLRRFFSLRSRFPLVSSGAVD